jgi:peptidyl-tRNA hydrolase, PTH1 family
VKAIIGLGNPGNEYEGTRHNAGFEIIDRLCHIDQVPEKLKLEKRFHAYMAKVNIFSEAVFLVKPVTYMNDSGRSVLAIKRFHKIPLKNFLIVHDDVSLPLGKIRFQKDGGAGGQHGIESIIECLGGDKNFNRLKIGIGPDPGGDVRHHFVLEKFNKKERLLLNVVVEQACEAVFKWLTADVDEAMNKFNGLDIREVL